MPTTMKVFATLAAFWLAAPTALAADAAPEIQRPPDSTAAQPIGQVHSLRNIPEACVRLDGEFTGEPDRPYTIVATRHERCAQRAVYVETAALKQTPDAASGWILNDRISVPRQDAPRCVATIEIWRKPGDAAPPELDAQGRSRIYLDHPQPQSAPPMFTATLHPPKGCP